MMTKKLLTMMQFEPGFHQCISVVVVVLHSVWRKQKMMTTPYLKALLFDVHCVQQQKGK
jgi:hypothetical protein